MDDELLTAVAEALRAHGVTDPQAVISAADAAVRVLGRDRCTHSRAVHDRHHITPVDGCPYCSRNIPPQIRKFGTSTVPTGGLL